MIRQNTSNTIRILSIVVLLIVVIVYSIFQAYKLISGPIIDVYTPQNGAVYSQTLIEIQGRARNIAYINLNDRKMFTDKDGYFSEKFLLSPGYNIIKLDAKDKFGKYTEKKLEIILKEY